VKDQIPVKTNLKEMGSKEGRTCNVLTKSMYLILFYFYIT